jgi:P-type Ca2+ transporter type 2C
LLSIAAVVSLSLGLFQDFGQTRPQGEPPVDWVEGVTILVAVLIVILVGSVNDWQKEKQFKVLNEKREVRVIKVIRDGEEQMIDIHSVVVGDVVLFEPGEIIPCDGIFLSGHNVRCDESGATGESGTIKKLSYHQCIALRERRLAEFDPDTDGTPGDGESTSGSRMNVNLSGLDSLGHTDCFVVSGSKVVEGIGSYLVIAVGQKSFNGRIMMGTSFAPLTFMFSDKAMTCSVTS